MTTDNEGDPLRAIRQLVTSRALALELGIGERRIREDARRLGLCVLIGKRMLLSPADIAALLDSWRPQPTQKTITPLLSSEESLSALRRFAQEQKANAVARREKRRRGLAAK